MIILPLNEVRPKRSCWRAGAARPRSAAVRRWICRLRRRCSVGQRGVWTGEMWGKQGKNLGKSGENRGKTWEMWGKQGKNLGKSGETTEKLRKTGGKTLKKHGGELRLGKHLEEWKNREKTHTHTLVTGECRKSECVKWEYENSIQLGQVSLLNLSI